MNRLEIDLDPKPADPEWARLQDRAAVNSRATCGNCGAFIRTAYANESIRMQLRATSDYDLWCEPGKGCNRPTSRAIGEGADDVG